MAECVRPFVAPVAKLVDAPDLGSGAERRTGSSPARRTISQYRHIINSDYLYFLRKGAMNAVPVQPGQSGRKTTGERKHGQYDQ